MNPRELKHFQPVGHFSTKDDILKLYIPVTSKRFVIEEQIKLKNKNISTLLVRVTDQSDQTRVNERITHILIKEYSLTQLSFDINRLKTDGQLKVMVNNSKNSFQQTEIDELECCLANETDICSLLCLDKVRKKQNKFGFKPNDREGSIIIGF